MSVHAAASVAFLSSSFAFFAAIFAAAAASAAAASVAATSSAVARAAAIFVDDGAWPCAASDFPPPKFKRGSGIWEGRLAGSRTRPGQKKSKEA